MSQENLKGTPRHEEVSSTKKPLTVDQGFEPSRRGDHGRAFSFFVARRYLFSKKKTHAINVISLISVIGVAIATMALVVVLSVFNGFHDLVAGFFTNFDPQLKVTPVKGKTVPADDPVLTQISKMPQVQVATQTVQDMALAVYQDKQAVITLKGVDDNFDDLTHINEILYGDGEFQLHTANLQFGTPGIRLAQTLGTGSYWPNFMKLYAPKRDGQLDLSNPDGGFVVDSLISSGVVFAVNQSKYDKNYMLTSLGFAQNLFGVPGMVSALEIRLKPGADIDQVKADMRRVAGDRFKVQDRFEQQADTFKIMQIEKLMAYIFLTFILVVACFNIVGSLSMLIIDKKKDVVTLRNLGATDKQVNRIFLFEGRLISVIGAIVGILLGLLMCWLQQEYGFVKMGKSDGTFVVNAYPVSVHYLDVFFVFLTVIAAGWLAVWYPVKTFAKRNLTI